MVVGPISRTGVFELEAKRLPQDLWSVLQSSIRTQAHKIDSKKYQHVHDARLVFGPHTNTHTHTHTHTRAHTHTHKLLLAGTIFWTMLRKIETSSKTPDTFTQPSLIRSCSLYSGPGSYNVFDCGLAQESVKRATLESTRKGGFGCSAQRNSIFHIAQTLDAPGPGQYVVGSSLSVHHLPISLPLLVSLPLREWASICLSLSLSLYHSHSFTLPASFSINIAPTVPANVVCLANSYPQIRAMTSLNWMINLWGREMRGREISDALKIFMFVYPLFESYVARCLYVKRCVCCVSALVCVFLCPRVRASVHACVVFGVRHTG